MPSPSFPHLPRGRGRRGSVRSIAAASSAGSPRNAIAPAGTIPRTCCSNTMAMCPGGIQITRSREAEPAEQVPGMRELLVTHSMGEKLLLGFFFLIIVFFTRHPRAAPPVFKVRIIRQSPIQGMLSTSRFSTGCVNQVGLFVLADLRPHQTPAGANLLEPVRASHLSLVLLILLCLQVQALQEHIFYFIASHRRQRVSADFPGLRISSGSFIVAFFSPSLPLSLSHFLWQRWNCCQVYSAVIITSLLLITMATEWKLITPLSVYPHGNGAKTNNALSTMPVPRSQTSCKIPN